jgi:hypothetical protein
MGQQSMGSTQVSNFSKSNLPAGTVVTVNLQGKPEIAPASSGSISLDNRSELLIGIGAAALVIAAAGIFIWRWRQEPEPAAIYEDYSREELLQAIADLDDEYELGRIGKDRYHREREELKGELVALWEEEQRPR